MLNVFQVLATHYSANHDASDQDRGPYNLIEHLGQQNLTLAITGGAVAIDQHTSSALDLPESTLRENRDRGDVIGRVGVRTLIG